MSNDQKNVVLITILKIVEKTVQIVLNFLEGKTPDNA